MSKLSLPVYHNVHLLGKWTVQISLRTVLYKHLYTPILDHTWLYITHKCKNIGYGYPYIGFINIYIWFTLLEEREALTWRQHPRRSHAGIDHDSASLLVAQRAYRLRSRYRSPTQPALTHIGVFQGNSSAVFQRARSFHPQSGGPEQQGLKEVL